MDTKCFRDIELMLINHAHCEMKAVSSAMTYIYRHTDKYDLVIRMSKIAREGISPFWTGNAYSKKSDIQYRANCSNIC